MWSVQRCAGWAWWVQASAEAGHPVGLLVATFPGRGMRTWARGKGRLRGVGPLEVGQKGPWQIEGRNECPGESTGTGRVQGSVCMQEVLKNLLTVTGLLVVPMGRWGSQERCQCV